MSGEKNKDNYSTQETVQHFLDRYSKEKEEEEYLENIASRYAVSGEKNYSLARSIVLDIHITEEYYINMIICLLFVDGGKKSGLNFSWKAISKEVGEIDYFKKLKVIDKFNIFSADSIKIMQQLNNLRRAFAHGHKEDHPDYKYKGKSIFQRKTIDLLISDHIDNVTKEMDDFMMKPD